jgi:hypothetical protein
MIIRSAGLSGFRFSAISLCICLSMRCPTMWTRLQVGSAAVVATRFGIDLNNLTGVAYNRVPVLINILSFNS